jgi:hypothetical protein
MSNIQNNEPMRLARMEAICNKIRSEMDDVMLSAYVRAVDEKDEVRAAEMARKIRNRMLDKSDAEMSLDRIGLDTSSTTSFLTSLKNIFDNQWAKYRQHLRDITTQEGFPFDIDWGVAPGDNKDSEV